MTIEERLSKVEQDIEHIKDLIDTLHEQVEALTDAQQIMEIT